MYGIKRICQSNVGILAALLVLVSSWSFAQQSIVISLAPIDGILLTPDNILGYHVQSSGPGNVQVKGSIRYRNSNLSILYSFPYILRQGINEFRMDEVHPQWQFSSSALQELFLTHKILPAGTFEYCVSIVPATGIKEHTGSVFDECLYHRAEDIFLINLIYPEDKAKLQEYNPMLSWVANYSFSSELTYRIRVAEIKQGQNPVNAVMRNQPVFTENNLMQNSIVYPVYAKPLVANQPYAWTVDAYYKGVLLGGSETWQFIIPDSTPVPATANRSYIDIKREKGVNHLTAIGSLKLKYVLDDYRTDVLFLEIVNERNEPCRLSPNQLKATFGDNRYDIDLDKSSNLKHGAKYILKIKTNTKHQYTLPFQYLNPEYAH